MDLGILKFVSPRKKWNSESSHFTPWLSQNIELLNEALGVELEVENTEVAVGPFSADILAKDISTGKYVVIENQLQKTDHDHLGKALTYASVLDASIIVWIATDFTEEHQKALDWLNDHTNDEISFYGVQVELWQIDDSKAAVKFNVLSKPNEAVRRAARTKSNDELTETRKFQYEFWSMFHEKLARTKKIPSLQTPRPQYWFDVSLGKSNINLSNTCNTDENTVGVRVYIKHQIADTMLPFLLSKKEEIEKSIGSPLIWNPNPDNRDKVIGLLFKTDFSDKTKLEEAVNWLVDQTVKFRELFSKIIQTP